jgi:hypothetical protein
MQELTVRVKQNPGSIELNFDEIEKALDARLKEYEGAVFTDESMDIAKKERAGLRKEKEHLDAVRKNIKKGWMKPYDDFDAKVKPLLAKFDKPIDLIDKQVKAYEDECRAKKRDKVKEVYAGLIDGMEEYLPFDKIYDEKWGNVGTSMKSIKEEISKKVSDAKTAVESINAMNSEKTEDALLVYKETLDVTKAIAVITNYERQKAEIFKREEERRRKEEERQRQAEIDRARAAEREAVMREEKIRKEAVPAEAAPSPAPAPVNPFLQPEDDEEDGLPFVQPTTVTAFYKVVATSQELEDVEMALNSMGIWFERREV